jgi:DNA polymerase
VVERENQSPDLKELLEFDWFNHKSTAPKKVFKPQFVSVLNVKDETPYDRRKRMLSPLSTACLACSMCELGRSGAEKNNEIRDPHVLSNINPTRFMVVGQNPGWEEIKKRQPFIGPSGNNWDTEIAKHGLERSDFYITNAVKCFTPGNKKPNNEHVERCSPFLQMEINLIMPLLVITLGAVPFGIMCEDSAYGESLGTIVKSKKYSVPVFPIYHPSPLNFREKSRKLAFERQVKLMCGLVKKLKKKHQSS